MHLLIKKYQYSQLSVIHIVIPTHKPVKYLENAVPAWLSATEIRNMAFCQGPCKHKCMPVLVLSQKLIVLYSHTSAFCLKTFLRKVQSQQLSSSLFYPLLLPKMELSQSTFNPSQPKVIQRQTEEATCYKLLVENIVTG